MKELKQVNNYTIVRQFSCLLEYLYRKGVYDAAFCSDSRMIMECCEREDSNVTLRFLSDEGGKVLPRLYYNDLLRLYARKIRCTQIAKIFGVNAKPRSINSNFAYLADYFYRQGLRDGINANPEEADGAFTGSLSCSKHPRPHSKYALSTSAWIDEIKMGARRLQSTWEDVGVSSSGMAEICRYIGSTVMQHEAAENIKKGLEEISYDAGPSVSDMPE